MADLFHGSITKAVAKATDPAAGTVLADTGFINAEFGITHVVLEIAAWMETGGAAAATFVIEHRNEANDTTLVSFEANFIAGDTRVIPFVVKVLTGERVRVIVGDVTAGANDDQQVLITGKVVVS